MEIITTKSQELRLHDGTQKIFCSILKDRITLSGHAVHVFGLCHGDRLIFIFDTDRFYFYVDNNADSNGFTLSLNSKNTKKGQVHAASLARLINERIGNLGISQRIFPIRVSNTKINEHVTYEILLHKKVLKK